MIKIMFVCHGNICRSPLAEFIMKDIVKRKNQQDNFIIASSATSTEEIGNGVYLQSRQILNSLGIDCSQKRAVQITKADYDFYDYIVCMDRNNVRNLNYIIGSDTKNKVSLLMDYANEHRDVADPWYTRDFNTTYEDVLLGCNALYDYITKSKQ